ncbi:MAG: hypothetical protein KHY88_03005 [Erysipelotrichaceae bacterium]|nr:hypothetical protein [Erysipelotrichaceae bacterium]
MSKVMAVMIGAGSMATAYLLMMKPEKRHEMAKKAEHYYQEIAKKM